RALLGIIRFGMPPLGDRALRAYVFAQCADASNRWPDSDDAPRQSIAPRSISALGAILRLRFPRGHPRASRAAIGYAPNLEALWIRPHQLYPRHGPSGVSALDEVELTTVEQLFYENRTLIPILRERNAGVGRGPDLEIRERLTPEQQ